MGNIETGSVIPLRSFLLVIDDGAFHRVAQRIHALRGHRQGISVGRDRGVSRVDGLAAFHVAYIQFVWSDALGGNAVIFGRLDHLARSAGGGDGVADRDLPDRKSTRLNSS